MKFIWNHWRLPSVIHYYKNVLKIKWANWKRAHLRFSRQVRFTGQYGVLLWDFKAKVSQIIRLVFGQCNCWPVLVFCYEKLSWGGKPKVWPASCLDPTHEVLRTPIKAGYDPCALPDGRRKCLCVVGKHSLQTICGHRSKKGSPSLNYPVWHYLRMIVIDDAWWRQPLINICLKCKMTIIW